jgi:glutamyl-tRNA synthetase
VLGDRKIRLNTVSDPVLIRADGTPLYTFTSVVDDVDFAITHIVRGEDHVSNTAVQLDIFAAIAPAKPAPRFAHLPLISGGEGEKLSKRIGSISLRSLKKDGIEPAALCAYLARLGTNKDAAALPMAELIETFSFSDFGRSPPRFDARQLLVLNRKFLQNLDFSAAAERLPAGADAAFWHAIRGNIDMLSEARHFWDVLHDDISATPDPTGICAAALDALPAEIGQETWKSWTAAIAAATGVKGKPLFLPLRLALTGEEHGPEMAALLPLMGRARVAGRLAACVVPPPG